MSVRPPTSTHREVSPQELARTWGVSQEAVKQWVADGDLKRNLNQFAVTTAEVQQFVDSPEGRALINAARLA